MMSTTIKDREAALRTRLAELDGRLHEIDDTLVSHNTRDWEDGAIEREEDEVLEDLGNAGKAEISLIHAALSRIEAGDYGICTQCGNDISSQRLDVLPATPFCRNCAP